MFQLFPVKEVLEHPTQYILYCTEINVYIYLIDSRTLKKIIIFLEKYSHTEFKRQARVKVSVL